MYKIFAVYLAVFAATFGGVKLFRRWSLRHRLLDIPNERSSHSVPTPRGGGMIIFLVSTAAFFVYTQIFADGIFRGYFAGALVVSIIGLVDDVRGLRIFLKFLFHSLAAGLAIWFFGGFGLIWLPFWGIVQTGVFGDLMAFIWIVGLINAYNFMDGIDGIAGTQAVTAGVGWSMAGWLLGIESVFIYGGVLASASLGFLMLNWQPAKIFMGDVGSSFLGYSFAVLPLLANKTASETVIASILPWIALFFVWFFVFDSFFTRFVRVFRVRRFWEPHREHIYQKLVINGISHAKAASLYGVLSLIVVMATAFVLKNSLNFGKIVFPIVVFETILLLVIWRLAEKRSKSKTGAKER